MKPIRSQPSTSGYSSTMETLITISPDGGWGWIVVMAAFFTSFVFDGANYTFGLFLEDISKTYQVHPTTVGIANSLMVGFHFCIGPLTCGLVNRFGFRLVSFLGGLISGTAFYFSTSAPTISHFLAMFGVLGGLGFSMMYVSSMIAVGFYFERWRPLATSIANAGAAAGILFFPMIVKGLLEGYSWRIQLKVIAALCIMASLAGLLYLPLQPIQVSHSVGASLVQVFVSVTEETHIQRNPIMTQRFHNKNFPTAAKMYEEANQDPSLLHYEGKSTYSLRLPSNQQNSRWNWGWWKLYKHVHNETRPMYRDDIFFHGEMINLKDIQSTSRHSRRSVYQPHSTPYMISVSRVTTQRDLKEHKELCICCTESVLRPLTTMLHLNLLKSPSFCLVALSGFFCILGKYVPFLYIMERATEMGLTKRESTYLLSAMGITNGIGRILGGLIANVPAIGPLMVSYLTVLICGFLTVFSGFFKSVYSQYFYAAMFGLTIPCQTSLKTPMIVELWGLEKLTNAFGILLLFQGMAAFMGVPVAGEIMKLAKSFNACFYFSGACLIIGGLLMLPVHRICDWEAERHSSMNLNN